MPTIELNAQYVNDKNWPPAQGVMYYAVLTGSQTEPEQVFMSLGDGSSVVLGTGERIVNQNWKSWAKHGVRMNAGERVTLTQQAIYNAN